MLQIPSHDFYSTINIAFFLKDTPGTVLCPPPPKHNDKKSIFEKHRCQLLHKKFPKFAHEMFFVLGQNNFNYFFHNIVFGGGGRGLLPGRALRNAMLHSCARIETCTKSCDEFLKDRCLENVTQHKTVVCVAQGALIQTTGQEIP